jgi:hypothetical protein
MSELQRKIPDLLKHVGANQEFIDINTVIFNILEGDLHTYVLESLRQQLKSSAAFEVAKHLIEPINILQRVTDKQTVLYSNEVTRTTENDTDQEILDFYVEEMNVNDVFADGNFSFNGTKVTAIEPFMDRGQPSARSIPSHMFLPYSDDIINPQRATVMMKFMGERLDDEGNREKIIFAYSNEEFIAFNQEGVVLPEYKQQNSGENPFGIIPQTYVNKSNHLLIPKADKDSLKITTLIPMLLTKLNFAIEFQAQSIIYGIDVDSENLEYNPNAFWVLKSDGEGNKPEIGSIKPEVDIQEVIFKIEKSMGMYLESKGIKAGSIGNVSANSASSGVALMIQEADVTSTRKKQAVFFQQAEADFWEVMKEVHNYWASHGLVSERRQFSKDFKVSVQYAEPKVVESQDDVIKREVVLIENKLSTKKIALSNIYPRKTEPEIEKMIKEIEEEEDSVEGLFKKIPASEDEE